MSYSQPGSSTFDFRATDQILTDESLFYYHAGTSIGQAFTNSVNANPTPLLNDTSNWIYDETGAGNSHFEPFTAAVNTWTSSAFQPPNLTYNNQQINGINLENDGNGINSDRGASIDSVVRHQQHLQQQQLSAIELDKISSFLPQANVEVTPSNPINADVSSDDNGKLYSCNRCGKQYCRKSTLKAHVKHHLGERPFICQICGKTFSQAANLTAHRRVHTGEKPFSCSICLRPFSQSSSLVTHKRTHTGERPYPCNHCDKAFTDSSTLTKHLRTHTGQKPYGCPLCMMRFSQSGNLHRHLKTHRSESVTKA